MKIPKKMHATVKFLGIATLGLAIGGGAVFAQAAGSTTSNPMNAAPDHMQHMRGGETKVPTMVGQDVFAAIQEIVLMLEADPKTDWSKVNVAALREHLVDMHEMALRAVAVERKVENGLQIDITGSARTLEAIRRVIPAHAGEMNTMPDLRVKSEAIPNGMRMTVTTSKATEVAHIRGLGYMGLMVRGAHHQPHHLALARGEHPH